MLLFDLSPVLEPYISVIIIAVIAVGGVYASSVKGKCYLRGKLFIESVGMHQAKKMCIKNGLFLVFMGITPQALALFYMAFF